MRPCGSAAVMVGWQTGQTAAGIMGVNGENWGETGGTGWNGNCWWQILGRERAMGNFGRTACTHTCTHTHTHARACAHTGIPKRHLLSAQPAADAQDSHHHNMCKSCLGVQVLHMCVCMAAPGMCTQESMRVCRCAQVPVCTRVARHVCM